MEEHIVTADQCAYESDGGAVGLPRRLRTRV